MKKPLDRILDKILATYGENSPFYKKYYKKYKKRMNKR